MEAVRLGCKELLNSEYMSLYKLDHASKRQANNFLIVVLAGCSGLVFCSGVWAAAVDSVVREREDFAGKIEESRQLLETTLASIGDAVIMTDSGGDIRFMNPRGRETHRLVRSPMPGKDR